MQSVEFKSTKVNVFAIIKAQMTGLDSEIGHSYPLSFRGNLHTLSTPQRPCDIPRILIRSGEMPRVMG